MTSFMPSIFLYPLQPLETELFGTYSFLFSTNCIIYQMFLDEAFNRGIIDVLGSIHKYFLRRLHWDLNSSLAA